MRKIDLDELERGVRVEGNHPGVANTLALIARIRELEGGLRDPRQGRGAAVMARARGHRARRFRRPDGIPELRDQSAADAWHAELDALDDAQEDALDVVMKACGCTLLCYWTEERIAHVRAHIAEIRGEPPPAIVVASNLFAARSAEIAARLRQIVLNAEHLSLHTADPEESDAPTEVSYEGYARQPFLQTPTAETGGRWSFGAMTGGVDQLVTHFGLVRGRHRLIFAGTVHPPIPLAVGVTPQLGLEGVEQIWDLISKPALQEYDLLNAEFELCTLVDELPHQQRLETAERLMIYFGRLCQELDTRARGGG